ncbi:MAG: YciI family protein [Terriglobia bacterium]|jgi:uncharacterized protein YciI|nr:YciI family protein [Terriglobia bacterium]
MYALAIISYRRPLEEIAAVTESHRAYVRQLKQHGILLASGPFDPRFGGALLLRVKDDDVIGGLDRVRDDDPFVKENLVQYELLPWNVMGGREGLDKL